jgi:hypothetical protein
MPEGSHLMAISAQQEMALIAPPFGDYSTGRLVGACFSGRHRKRVLIPLMQGGWRIYAVDGGSRQQVHGIGPGDSIPVSIMEVAGGKTSPWKTIHPSQPVLEIHDLHVTPDGQAYAYNYVTAQSDLYVAHGLN